MAQQRVRCDKLKNLSADMADGDVHLEMYSPFQLSEARVPYLVSSTVYLDREDVCMTKACRGHSALLRQEFGMWNRRSIVSGQHFCRIQSQCVKIATAGL